MKMLWTSIRIIKKWLPNLKYGTSIEYRSCPLIKEIIYGEEKEEGAGQKL
jgi:hypothetical protein